MRGPPIPRSLPWTSLRSTHPLRCKPLHEVEADLEEEASAFAAPARRWRRVITVRCYGHAFFEQREVVNDIRIAPLGRHPSDRSADRDDRWGEHTLPYNWQSDLHGEPIAPGSVARRTRACWRMAHHGTRGAALRGRGQPIQYDEMARAGLDSPRRDPGAGSFLLIRSVAQCHSPECAHLSRLCRRSSTSRRRARSRHRPRQASGTMRGASPTKEAKASKASPGAGDKRL